MERKTHIWLITTDQMRADAVGIENATVLTPELDKLAAEGTFFTGAYCASPVCTPSRASIFTGRYPHVHGAWSIGTTLKEDEITLCDHLKKADYKTIGIGKMHFRPQMKEDFSQEYEDPIHRDRGRSFDGTYYGFDEHHITEDNCIGEYLEWLKAQDPDTAERFLKDRFRSSDAQSDIWESEIPPELHQTYWVAERSIEAILSHNTDQPLFLWSSFVDPHHPFDPPKAYTDMYANIEISAPIREADDVNLRPQHLLRQGLRGYWPGGGQEHSLDENNIKRLIRNYYAMITFIDEQIGRIKKAWRQKEIYDDLIILFTSDHGELLGDHGLLYKGPWFYEGLTRIPMIVCGPGIASGQRTSAFMEHVDIVPTLLEAVGLNSTYGIQGVSQLGVLAGRVSHVRDSALTAYIAHDRGINAKCLRTSQYKLVVFAGETYGELYDLKEDPQENINRFEDSAFREIRSFMMELLAHRMIQDQDPLPERRSSW
ncbi:sulfatase-like hydrolase/transferase [Paenibacillus sp. DMB5]|uniref:sulfatase family protein n=1 Tax=Paenibacillus sp. DMB5 TaxID=1780103 RepID=UPI000838C9B9|nr:sulfatase-like hydrolase/transferase [Paenibacillus sp. DMB5]